MKVPEESRKEHISLLENSKSSGDRDTVKQRGVFVSNFTTRGAQLESRDGRKVAIREGFLDVVLLKMKP